MNLFISLFSTFYSVELEYNTKNLIFAKYFDVRTS